MAIGVRRYDITTTGFSEPVDMRGKFNLTIDANSPFVGIVLLQYSVDGGNSWSTIATYDGPVFDVGDAAPGDYIKLRIGSNSFTSGTAKVRIAQ